MLLEQAKKVIVHDAVMVAQHGQAFQRLRQQARELSPLVGGQVVKRDSSLVWAGHGASFAEGGGALSSWRQMEGVMVLEESGREIGRWKDNTVWPPHQEIEALAREMAEAVNGGSWNLDYVEAQREGWRLKARWVLERFQRVSHSFRRGS